MLNNYAYRFGVKMVLVLIFLLSAGFAFAQEEISGKVVDATSGQSMPGTSVYLKGTTMGTLTDVNGLFSINVNMGDVIVFSYVGYLTQEIAIKEIGFLEIALEEDIDLLDEVVIVGYGSQKKSVVTGSISSINAKELEEIPVQRVDQVLQGR